MAGKSGAIHIDAETLRLTSWHGLHHLSDYCRDLGLWIYECALAAHAGRDCVIVCRGGDGIWQRPFYNLGEVVMDPTPRLIFPEPEPDPEPVTVRSELPVHLL